MRTGKFLAVAIVAVACGCDVPGTGRSPWAASHPALDRDYAGQFAGAWSGSATVTMDGQSQTVSDVETISYVGFNRVAIAEMCPGVAGGASLDGPTTFSMDPLTCPPAAEDCGPVTITYRAGSARLSGGTLTLSIQGTADGCGGRHAFTMSFTGTQVATPPTVAVSSDRLTTGAGVPVALDASSSVDPGGSPLQFSWQISSQPSGGDGALGNAATATPTFTANVAGLYRVDVTATSSNGLSAKKSVSIAVLPAATQSFILLQSDPGDWIGGGQAFLYTKANANISVTSSGGSLGVSVAGAESWTGQFQLPSGVAQLVPGTYSGLTRLPFEDPATGGLDWSGEGRGCSTLTGSLTITAASYSGSTLTALDLAFEQHCEGGSPALHGQVHWVTADTTAPAGPVVPPPSGLWQPAVGATPASGNYVYLQSDAGDYIGAGRVYTYTQANAVLAVTASGAHLGVTVTGDQGWSGDFQGMNTLSQLQPGYYGSLERYPFHNPVTGGLDWWGEGRGCNTLTGWFVVDGVTYTGSTLTSIDLRFEQHCEGGTPALHGQVHWAAGDTTAPAGPVIPPPAGLWQPAAGVTPASGNYVYLQSDAGDYIGAGQVYAYTQANALLAASASGAHLSVRVTGDQGWSGDFQAMNTLTQLQPGYYGSLERYPFHNPVTGGLSWSGEGRGCNTLTGWFVVDGVTYSGSTLTSIDLRFEQHCEGGTSALHGQIHWAAGDTTVPTGPVTPPPAGLWQPASGVTPASGNYVYLQSDAGDFIGAGQVYTYTQANAILAVSMSGAHLSARVTGDQGWSGDFQGMNTLGQLQPGYYGSLERYPFNNPVTGGLSWSGEGRGCNTLTGWFVVDGVTYSGSTLTSIDLRFEQHCEGGTAALHGQVHWAAGDTTAPAGPVVPPPSGLWQPAAGVTPASGNYVYLQSDAGDYIGAGQAYTYTQANAVLTITASGTHLGVTVTGDQGWWGDFQGMNTLGQLQPGYYGSLERYPFNNPVTGGLDWSGEGRGCNTLTGWFVVDGVTYSGSTLTSIDLRFEQHCEGGTPALHGQVHWAAGDTTAPAGPVVPPPSGLWQPAAGVTPASGNYVYLQSDAGDYIGAGRVYTYTQASATLTMTASGAHLGVRVTGAQSWSGDFQGMNTLTQLQPGYYGGLERYPFHNPVTGGLSWWGEGRGCNTLTGWFVVDGVTYSGSALTSIDLRFEQHCEGGTPALHGQVHWAAP